MRKVFASALANGTVVVPRNIGPAQARGCTAGPYGDGYWVPSGAIVREPRVILSAECRDALSRSGRHRKSGQRADVLGESGVVGNSVATAPTALQLQRLRNVARRGRIGSCRPRRGPAGDRAFELRRRGVPFCSTTPSHGSAWMVEPAALCRIVSAASGHPRSSAGSATVTALHPLQP